MSEERPDPGLALLLLGALALLRTWWLAAPPPSVFCEGQPVPLRVEALSGEEFRLLPGVGPALAARLEAARVAGGGLGPEPSVPGVGPALRAKWAALRPSEAVPTEGLSPPGAGLR